MKLKSLLIIIFSIALFGLADNAEAQAKNKRKKVKKTSKDVSKYRGGPVSKDKGGELRAYEKFEPYYFVGAQINAGNYFGDLAPVNKVASADLSFTRLGFGLSGGYKFHHSFAVTAELNWIRVFGDDVVADPNNEADYLRYVRNLSFRNDIKELRVGLQIFLIPNYGGSNQHIPFNAYLSLGAAVFHHEPKGKVPDFDYQEALDGSVAAPQAGEWVKLRPLGTEGQNFGVVKPYKSISFSIPIAIGGQMRIPNTDLTASLEFGLRYLFTDYIDDVSTKYVDLDSFGDDALARIMSDRSAEPTSLNGEARELSRASITKSSAHDYFTSSFLGSGTDGEIRGNPDNNDMLFVTQIKVSYILRRTIRKSAKYR